MAVHDDLSFGLHDSSDWPAEAAATIDQGLGDANHAAAPLHEVQPLACFARKADGDVVGGAVGRTWGDCCELQQLWVAPALRRHGLGAQLVTRFEAQARLRGCTLLYLETFSFQAPRLYASLGFQVVHRIGPFPHGISKLLMEKRLLPG